MKSYRAAPTFGLRNECNKKYGLSFRSFILVVCVLVGGLSLGCSHTPHQKETLPEDLRQTKPGSRQDDSSDLQVAKKKIEIDRQIDIASLTRTLGFDRDQGRLGYKEKTFNTCEVGSGFPSNFDCHQEFLVSISFRIVCRQSEDTITEALTEDDLFPLSDRRLKWELAEQKAELVLDETGRGRIVLVSRLSPKNKKLKLKTEGKFLQIQANQVTQIVTPKPWCN